MSSAKSISLPASVDVEPLGPRWRRLPGIVRMPAGGEAAALTFDDGPHPDGTRAVLDALDAAGAQATFFVLGESLLRHGGVARETLERGHELALHGFDHTDHNLLGPDEARDAIERGLWTFEAVLGFRPRWFRPPFGRFSDASYAACLELGLEPVYWSASGRDWELISAKQIAQHVSERFVAGAIVLLHDSPQLAERPSAGPTAEAVKLLGSHARKCGIELRSLGHLVRSG